MPFDHLAAHHYTPGEIKKAHELLNALQDLLQPRFISLNEAERSLYASINEKNKLVISKVKDYYEQEPDLASDEIDWKEFMLAYQDRAFLSFTITTMQRIVQSMDSTRILYDYDNYKAALHDYEYALHKNDGTDPRFEKKVKELKQFFEKNRSTGNEEEDTELTDIWDF